MFATKNAVDKYFHDNWADTPVQYDGAKFEEPGDGIWVSIKVTPYDRLVWGECTQVLSEVKVFCYHTSVTDMYALADKVIEFLELTEIGNVVIDRGHSDGFGVDDLGSVFSTAVVFNAMHTSTGETTRRNIWTDGSDAWTDSSGEEWETK